jgi:hypothetical protein
MYTKSADKTYRLMSRAASYAFLSVSFPPTTPPAGVLIEHTYTQKGDRDPNCEFVSGDALELLALPSFGTRSRGLNALASESMSNGSVQFVFPFP